MKKLFLALPFLLAGCQAERVAFQFQPVAPAAGGGGRLTRPAPAAGPAPTSEPASRAVAAYSPGPAAPRPARIAKRAAPRQHPAPEALALASSAAPTTPALLAGRPALRRLVRQRTTAGPAHAAESGLGRIALFFLAVVLGLLAGLGALVSVIFGTGFFTGVGFAAAGLVVLFLLYSLLSGGKKKSKPAK